jgi:hypothetical protein
MRNRILGRTASLLAPLAMAFVLGGCAGVLSPLGRGASVGVAPSDRLFLSVAPFDAVVRAELARGGLDADRTWEDVNAEIRYQLALRRQEEALDSAGATVAATVTVRHLQPGSGNAGAFGAFLVTARRAGRTDSVAWDWRARAKDNVPAAFAARHLSRGVAGEVLRSLKPARPSSDEPPPPLMLIK